MPGPKATPDELHIAGVRLLPRRSTFDHKTNVYFDELECMVCRRHWPAIRTQRGYVNTTYWRCPKGCNSVPRNSAILS